MRETQIQISLQARQEALSTTVARLLVQNSENEEQAAQRIVEIYDRVQREVYVFLAATLAAILLTGFSMIRWNRRLFARMAELSERRSELAQKLIATQESTLRYISRELHDEFGQILHRNGIDAPGAPGLTLRKVRLLRNDLQEVRQIAQAYAGEGPEPVPGVASGDVGRSWAGVLHSTGTSRPWKDKPELPYPMRSRACRSTWIAARECKSIVCCRKH